jgi:hypothetical protein
MRLYPRFDPDTQGFPWMVVPHTVNVGVTVSPVYISTSKL